MIPRGDAGGRPPLGPGNRGSLGALWTGGLGGQMASPYGTLSSASLAAMLRPSSASRSLLWLSVVAVGLGFFTVKLGALTSAEFEFGSEEVELVSSGLIERIVSRGLAYLILGAFGCWALSTKDAAKPVPRGLTLWLLVGFTVWCSASVLWSGDRSNTMMRCVQLACVLVAALGLGRLLSARDLCRVVIIVLSFYIGFGFLMEVANGVFRPWVSGYRFAGGVHPNLQSQYCAILAVAAVAMIGQPDWPRSRSFWLLGLAVPLLILTGSRTSLGGMLVGMAAFGALRFARTTKIGIVLAAGFMLSVAVLFAIFFMPELHDRLAQMALMGRERDTEALTGRVPLWAELVSYVRERPLTGFGYGGFWHMARKEELFDRVMWIPPSAHNAYLDAVLNIGLVGALLLFGAGAYGWVKTWQAFSATRDTSYAFFIGLFAILFTGSFTESLMVYPTFAEFVSAAGMAHVSTLPFLAGAGRTFTSN